MKTNVIPEEFEIHATLQPSTNFASMKRLSPHESPLREVTIGITSVAAKTFAEHLEKLPAGITLWTTQEPRLPGRIQRFSQRFRRLGATNAPPYAFNKFFSTPHPAMEETSGLIIDWTLGHELVVQLVDNFPQLRWLHVVKSGVDHLPLEALKQRQLHVTSSKGAYTEAVAEFAMGLIYLGTKRYLEHHDQQDRSLPIWTQSLQGQNILILGTGNIGSLLATLASRNGMKPWGVNSDGRPVEGFVRTASWREAGELARSCTCVVDCLPLTPDTNGRISQDFFSVLPHNSSYINVGRVETVDLAALAKALHAGTLGFAALDTEPERVRMDKKMRSKILITHHSAYATQKSKQELARLLIHNITAFAAGQPLAGEVDLDRRY